jgi:hypothetical protein
MLFALAALLLAAAAQGLAPVVAVEVIGTLLARGSQG